MKIRGGFTGTRTGMSVHQMNMMAELLRNKVVELYEFHHGDCVGADADAHDMVRMFFPRCVIHAHPANIPRLRAHTDADVIHDPKPPLERNQDIVNACELLIATPKTERRELRAGTWATIRYAERNARPLIIIFPSRRH